MKKYLIIPFLVLLVTAQIYSTTDCACNQLLSSEDCTKWSDLNCSWDSTKNKCGVSSTVTPTTQTYAAYCDPFSQKDCPNTTGCAWVSSKCTFFTGCTPFAKTTDSDCSAISSKCTSDGTHCIEKSACNTYLKSIPCVKNAAGAYCYWDTTKNVCVDANTCDKLPTSLISDPDCRIQIATCTAKTGGGCQDSGVNCSDQKTQISCAWNKLATQACYWNGTTCVDRICDNAANTLTTDDSCIAFKSDGTCTIKSGGGCITRSTCQAATIQAACVKNSSGSLCYWNGTACVDKICTNAPATMTTNSACQGFISTCITTGAGCISNGACSVATVQSACDKNSTGGICIWNTTCKDKTCENAPSTNNTHDLCTIYLSSCTVNSSSNGCVQRTCDNAPNSIVTNENCEIYLPKFNCVAKTGGGCVTNGTCNTLGQTACVKDISGNDCFWDTTCKDKICVNAPASANTHALCQDFMKTCTVNASGTCIDFTCQNIQTPDVCTVDSLGNPCIFRAKCYLKKCSYATTQTSHDACQAFYSQCTLSNTGTGCVTIPQSCSFITIQDACYLRQDSNGTALCGWNGKKCIDKDCTTIDKSITTSTACGIAMTGCVSANPVNGTVSGCMALPATCAGRQSKDNCEVSGSITCIWNPTTTTCVQKSCLTASINGSTGYVSTFTDNTSCSGYMSGCILNNTTNGCMTQVATCNLLTSSTNCGDGVKTDGGNCIWVSSTGACVDKTCANIPLTSHTDCNAAYNQCTVNVAKTNCQASAACSTYNQDQCHLNSQGRTCVWTGTVCRDQTCADADSTYQTSDSCVGFSVPGGICNVISRVQGKGCMARLAQCSMYLTQAQCFKDSSNNDCAWNNNKCIQKSTVNCPDLVFASYLIDGSDACELFYFKCKLNLTNDACITKSCEDFHNTAGGSSGGIGVSKDSDCSSLDPSCTISSMACITRQDHCSDYSMMQCMSQSPYSKKEGQCLYHGTCFPTSAACSSFKGTTCTSIKNTCKPAVGATDTTPCIIDCTMLPNATTQAQCQAEDPTCAINSKGNKCVNMLATCDLYGADVTSCGYSLAGPCVNDGTNCLVPTSSNCNLVKGTNLTDADCAKYNSQCQASRSGEACATIQTDCTKYSISNCTHTPTNECTGDSYYGSNCLNVTSTTTCAQLFLGGGNTTAALCKKKIPSCGLYSGNCAVITCDMANNPKNFSDCNTLSSTCTWNGTACITISATCAAQSSSECYQATEGDCIAIGSFCVIKRCDNAPTTNTSHADCTTFLPTCTVAKIGGCINRQACNQYTTGVQCTFNASGKPCYWSDVNYLCLDMTCENIDPTSSFNTHNLCNAKLSTCTVKSSNGFTVNGCQTLTTCSANKVQVQCVVNAAGANCEWNTNVCLDKSCTSAPNSNKTHASCLDHNGTNTCTVAAVAGTNGAANTLGGCIALGACSSYIDAEQCKINASGGQCGWNGSKCADFSCTTSPASNNTDALCQAYKTGCTVDQDGSGCIALLSTCDSYLIEGNCVADSSGNTCSWNSTTTKCVTRACDNAPDTAITATDCNNYLLECTQDVIKCNPKICDDFQFTTDSECKTSLSKCTTDGTQCVLRGQCAQALNKAGCVTDSSGNQCEWILAASADAQPYCTLKTCLTAPTSNTTVSQCATYFTNCTTKNGGGCITKSTCSAANVQSACTVASDGTKCSWDTTVTPNICRNKDCQDFQGSTHAVCQTINSSCTAGVGSNCARIKSCSNTTVRAACIQGTDGPCLWISGVTNSDGSKGACYPYTSCKSLTWNSDSQCKLISSNCTTNGSNCLGISLCSETNVNGGCVTGYDGSCIQTVSSLGSTDPAICKAFTQCSDAYYATHLSCQTANNKCTTNGTTGCIPFAACSTYKQAGCYINVAGQQMANGKVTSTGLCTWDNTTLACRDQICSDLTGTTHSACVAQLSTCTSDGTNCLTQETCSKYTQNQCSIAVGTDGICFWQVTTATITTPICRVMNCADVANGTTTTVCQAGLSGCVSNGTSCVVKDNCSTYTTQTSCNSGGLNGICVFSASKTTGAAPGAGTCSVMTSCAIANNDQNACNQAKLRCSWVAESGSEATVVPSKCLTHTCASYQATNNACANFQNWAETLQSVCVMKNGACTETDPTTLSQTDCYTASNYAYTWSASTSKCGVCTQPGTNNSSGQNNSTINNSNETTTSGFALGFATIIFGYLVF